MHVRKLQRGDKIAVLVSRGWGAGWYSWNSSELGMLFDPEIVEMLERSAEDAEIIKYASEKYPDAYLGGLDGLSIQWVKVGTKFRVDEYDGAESLEILEDVDWLEA